MCSLKYIFGKKGVNVHDKMVCKIAGYRTCAQYNLHFVKINICACTQRPEKLF